MKIDKTTGILDVAELILSPNHDDRPKQTDINLLVVHNISLPPGEFGGPYISQLFCNQINENDHDFFKEIIHLKVSAHLLIRRNGDIIQYVPFHKRAWHAGVSSFKEKTACNNFSIGIEMEGTDVDAYETIQYEKLSQVTEQIMKTYPAITKEHIQGHCDIAPGRKTDPGDLFDWEKYLNRLN